METVLKKFLALSAVALAACLGSVQSASALTSFQLQSVEGSDLKIDVTIENVSTSLIDGVRITLDVAPGYYADMRSVYFHIADESLLNSTFALGLGLTQAQIDANSVEDLYLGNNITGLVADTYGGFDVGLGIGTPTTIIDDVDQITFYVAALGGTITEDMFQTLPFAVHAEFVGTGSRWYQRLGTSDLAGIVPGDGWNPNTPGGGPDNQIDLTPAPEPATAMLGGMTLVGLALASRRRR